MDAPSPPAEEHDKPDTPSEPVVNNDPQEETTTIEPEKSDETDLKEEKNDTVMSSEADKAPAEVPKPAPIKRPHRKLAIISALVVVLLLNGSMTAASLYIRHKTASMHPTAVIKSTGTAAAPKTSAKSTETDSPSTLHYVSTSLHIEFDYPVSWRLSASSANNSIDITSEQFAFTDYSGAKKSGTVHIGIDSKDSGGQFGYISGEAKIMANSKSLSYKNPTTVQRKVTNLTYALSSTYKTAEMNAGGADYLLVTGGMAYSKGQFLGDKDYLSTDPQIYAYIESCPETSCRYLATAAATPDTWNTDENLLKIQDLIASIKVTQ
jgi:hypothetical protein